MGFTRYVVLIDQNKFVQRIVKDSNFSLDPILNDFVHRASGIRRECLDNEQILRLFIQHFHDYLNGHELQVLNQKTYENLSKRLAETPSHPVNLFDHFGKIMFDTAASVLYGETFFRKHGQDLRDAWWKFTKAFGILQINMPFKHLIFRSAYQNRDYFVNKFRNMSVSDDMSHIVQARIELMNSLDEYNDDKDRAAQHAIIMWAAAVNMVPAACWTLFDVVSHPGAMEAIQKELENIDITTLHEQATLNKLTTLEQCINETMRRAQPTLLARTAVKDTSIINTDGTRTNIRKNDFIMCPSSVLYTDSQAFDHPFEYRFDRNCQSSKAPALLFFGTGPRMCPGRYLALAEIKMLVAIVLSTMNIELLMDENFRKKTHNHIDFQYTHMLGNAGPLERDKHQFQVRCTLKKKST